MLYMCGDSFGNAPVWYLGKTPFRRFYDLRVAAIKSDCDKRSDHLHRLKPANHAEKGASCNKKTLKHAQVQTPKYSTYFKKNE